MAHPDTFTLELPTDQLAAAHLFPPRLSPGDRHDEDRPLLLRRAGRGPRRHRSTFQRP